MTAVRASVFIATSLDGYIARENGGLDWLPAAGAVSEDIDNGYREFLASVDTCVMGRRTFEKVLTLGPWPYSGKRSVVLTSRSTGLAPLPNGAEFMGGAPEEIVRRLGERGATHLYVDGGDTIRRFLEAGLIQRLVITRIPVILGAGIPLFGPVGRDIHLQHVATRSYPSGFVQSEYAVVS